MTLLGNKHESSLQEPANTSLLASLFCSFYSRIVPDQLCMIQVQNNPPLSLPGSWCSHIVAPLLVLFSCPSQTESGLHVEVAEVVVEICCGLHPVWELGVLL